MDLPWDSEQHGIEQPLLIDADRITGQIGRWRGGGNRLRVGPGGLDAHRVAVQRRANDLTFPDGHAPSVVRPYDAGRAASLLALSAKGNPSGGSNSSSTAASPRISRAGRPAPARQAPPAASPVARAPSSAARVQSPDKPSRRCARGRQRTPRLSLPTPEDLPDRRDAAGRPPRPSIGLRRRKPPRRARPPPNRHSPNRHCP